MASTTAPPASSTATATPWTSRKGHCDNPATTTVEQGANGASCTILRDDDVGRVRSQIVEPPGGTHYVVAKGHGGTKLQWKIQRSTIDMTQASFTRPEDYDGALPHHGRPGDPHHQLAGVADDAEPAALHLLLSRHVLRDTGS